MNIKRLNVVLIMCMTLLVSACDTMYTGNPYSGDKELNKTTKYGVASAIGCGLVGALASDRGNKNENALGAAAACGAIGAGVGYYMDKQNQKLTAMLQGTGVHVVKQGDNIQLVMPDVTFKTDSADISSSYYAPLNSVATVLKEFNKTNVDVVGYTDSRGSEEHNMILSQNRAQSVASYLASQGVASQRLSSMGMGEAYPVGDNNTAAGQQMNRRVLVTIRPQPGAGQ
jgi:outer membrane protein OmpA-like peptidoglycan-associated protein